MRVLLVLGFGPFPGVRKNPSAEIARRLFGARARLGRFGWRVEFAVLPVTFAAAQQVDCLLERVKPKAVLALGLSSRRKPVCIETRAFNRVSLLRPDSSGLFATSLTLRRSEADQLRTSWQAEFLRQNLVMRGLDARLSRNAGDYVCNALYWRLLDKGAIPALFVHIPLARILSPGRLALALASSLPPLLRRMND